MTQRYNFGGCARGLSDNQIRDYSLRRMTLLESLVASAHSRALPERG